MQEVIETEICLIGLGPAGIGFLYRASKDSNSRKILCIESGPKVQDRGCLVLQNKICDFKPVCQVTGGFGGSSLMAGGKLSAYPAGIGLENIVGSKTTILKAVSEAKSIYKNYLTLREQEISSDAIKEAESLYQQKGFLFKHYYSSLYTQEEFLQANFNLQEDLLKSCSILFNTKVVNISKSDGCFYTEIKCDSKTNIVKSSKVVLGVGKSGYELTTKLQRSLNLPSTPNRIEIGLRVEFPIQAFPEIDQYHFDLKLKRNGCKTFCISKGGKIALYLKDGLLYTEGYDNYLSPTEFTNLGFLYSIAEDKLDTTEYYQSLVSQRKKQKIFKPIRQNYGDFLADVESTNYTSGSSITCFQQGNINTFLPDEIKTPFHENLKTFVDAFINKEYHPDINVFFPELNYGGFNFALSSSFECIKDFYLIGECSGKFIGILQALASGLICYDKISNEE